MKHTNHGRALVSAGGTGGHIFPGLALAQALREAGVDVHWLGSPAPSMESDLIGKSGIEFHTVGFSGVRGKGWKTKILSIFKLWGAFRESVHILRVLKPQVVVTFGGYITFPAGLASWWCKVPLLIHEQNAIPGMANRCLAHLTHHVYTAFPNALLNRKGQAAQWVGNPMRKDFLNSMPRSSNSNQVHAHEGSKLTLKLLVVGGSLGAQALNEIVPQALSLLPVQDRPKVMHQSGAKQIQSLKERYAKLEVQAEVVPFIEDMASAMKEADVLIARAGASTVSEVAALGLPTLFVPFPHAVDDHQTKNAGYLVDQGGAWMRSQEQLSPEWLAQWLLSLDEAVLHGISARAQACAKTTAVDELLQASLAFMAQSVNGVDGVQGVSS